MSDHLPQLSPRSPLSRRSLLRAGGLGALGLGLSGCGFAPTSSAAAVASMPPIDVKVDGPLVYFNWADYIEPTVFAGFQKEYGVPIIQSNFDSMESMVAKLDAGNRYDVIFPSAKYAQRLVEAGRLRGIDHSRLRNAELVFGSYTYFANPWYDPRSAHTVPFTMYKTGIGWRKDKLGSLTGSWQDLWDAQSSGTTFLLDDEDEVLGMAALKLGLDLNTTNQGELNRITTLLGTLRPHLRGFSSDDYNNLLNGNATMTQAWSGDMVSVLSQANDASVYGFEVAREGSPINSDCFAIPANAQHPGTAMLFIDYLLRPENAIKTIKYLGYPMPVKGTESTYASLVEQLPQCLIEPGDLRPELYFQNASSAGSQARDAAWTDVKAG
ncbi:polyamine ABC transporter substrate-binding protein [Streptacidiphilus fuscans]|uniref:Spermidine/putrescine ABC transporter substrate-binding protein n=1 Tax=Streptacidiphilus fuscans TaxID=2789292 RepID=A0A931FF48_9ACTN|nr:spermidine/putrescine ABC transporter substrate-binding protein [Streptacidiphilus fuscans]MBF9069411.1 spermidine/putrescine ABC transporter substrate-binding protein [Streptacidiphilus fuscans]